MRHTVWLTSFLNFTLSVGAPRLTSARNIWRREVERYRPCTDFWYDVRTAVRRFHAGQRPALELEDRVSRDLTRRHVNAVALEHYTRFLEVQLRREGWVCFQSVPKCNLLFEQPDGKAIDLVVNPDFCCCDAEGVRYVVKLHLEKQRRISKDRVGLTLAAMKLAYPDFQPMIIDVFRRREYSGSPSGNVSVLLKAEVQALLVLLEEMEFHPAA